MKENRAFQYRIYPTKEQEALIERTFGCCRFVYNQVLSLQSETYANGGKYISWTNANNYCNQVLKVDYPFLKEVDKFALTNSIIGLDRAFRSFFDKQCGYPSYKSKKRSRKSYTTNYSHNNIVVMDKGIKLPKLKVVKAKVHRKAPSDWTLKGATISQNAAGEYYCSVLYEYEKETANRSLDVNRSIGLDYKSDGLYAASTGVVCGSPKFFREAQKTLAREQRKLSRKKKGSNNYLKQKQKVAKVYRHIANQRTDFLHKEALALAEEWDIVCVETLDMKEMSNRSFGNGKATMDNGYGEFLQILEYKLKDRGKVLVKVDRYYPSSQLCSCCSTLNHSVKRGNLSEWTCPACGATHNRDFNAAENIRREGVRIYLESEPNVA